MADIELVIKIPQDAYELMRKRNDLTVAERVIANGKPLPKGHGKLVDVNSVPKEDRSIIVKSLLHPGTIAFAGGITLEEYVNDLPTIIEADKEKV